MKTEIPVPSLSVSGKVKGLSIGMATIEYLLDAHLPRGVTQIATALEIAPSSAHDVLATLTDLGFVEKDPKSHLYRLSAGAFRLVHHIAERFGPNLKIANLLPTIATENNASVYIHTLWGREVILISAIGEFGPSTSLGTVAPVYASAAGKALVAQLPEDMWPGFAPGTDAAKLTRYTNIDALHFRNELLQACSSGVAVAERTASEELCAIAAPILTPHEGRQFSVALVYQHQEWNLKNLPDLKKAVLRAAERLAKALQ